MAAGHVTCVQKMTTLTSKRGAPTDLCLGPSHSGARVVNLKVFVNPAAWIGCYLPIPLSPWASYQAKFLLLYPEDKLKRPPNPTTLNNESAVLCTK